MIKLKQLDPCDGMDVFSMLKKIEAVENSFTNPVKNMNYQEYKNWLLLQDQWRRGINLPNGYVKQTIYWLYIDEIPVGIGKDTSGTYRQFQKQWRQYWLCDKFRVQRTWLCN